MSYVDLYSTGTHRRNLAHFASIASLAAVDGAINSKEKELLDRFANKLDITQAEYKEIMNSDNKYPINPPASSEERLERLFDLFRIIFVDNVIDEEERNLITKYAIGLGYRTESANLIIKRSIDIFTGKIDFEDYLYLLKH
ncbi:TerB family tellurite resistance protein [Arenibacter sp. F20364]|uniref:tellurite resistance TerB family protein n=1 Tax=Arenibacter sp. F20364 TaxID=2926415 RepID=UPI001FF19A35|nr:TerB family tellurite resistance protein [Arenibacter sp. F20364]MCK0192228.1 TerB family tellurite resistance protein [Arenibacter sp. F20364]